MLCHEKEKLKVLEPHVMILLYPHFDSPVQLGTTEEGQYLLSEVAYDLILVKYLSVNKFNTYCSNVNQV